MKKNTILDQYLYDLQEGNLAAATYAAGKTVQTLASPIIKGVSAVAKAYLRRRRTKLDRKRIDVTWRKTRRKQAAKRKKS